MPEVVLVRERCASEDPPDDDRAVWTNVGPLSFTDEHSDFTPSRRYKRLWVCTLGGMPVTPQPSVWFDFPRDTERETLTTDDLRFALETLEAVASDDTHYDMWASLDNVAARLRAALDALTKEAHRG